MPDGLTNPKTHSLVKSIMDLIKMREHLDKMEHTDIVAATKMVTDKVITDSCAYVSVSLTLKIMCLVPNFSMKILFLLCMF